MKKRETERGVYVRLPDDLNQRLDMITKLLPCKEDGTRWHKQGVIALACRKYADVFFSFIGNGTVSDMIAKAKRIDPDGIEVSASVDEDMDLAESIGLDDE